MPHIVETVERGIVAWNPRLQSHLRLIKKDGNYLWIRNEYKTSDIRFMSGIGYIPDIAVAHYSYSIESALSWARIAEMTIQNSRVVSVVYVD